MSNNAIEELKIQIESIHEYLATELCKKCEEMTNRLIECERLLQDAKDQ